MNEFGFWKCFFAVLLAIVASHFLTMILIVWLGVTMSKYAESLSKYAESLFGG